MLTFAIFSWLILSGVLKIVITVLMLVILSPTPLVPCLLQAVLQGHTTTHMPHEHHLAHHKALRWEPGVRMAELPEATQQLV